jgi:hypothetical protein
MWKVFIISLFLPAILFASEFKSVDFRQEFGPQRIQGGIGWCFAFSGADLLTHWLYKHGEISSLSEDQIISASAVAFANLKVKSKDEVKDLTWFHKFKQGQLEKFERESVLAGSIRSYIKDLNREIRAAWGEKLERLQEEVRRHHLLLSSLRRSIDDTRKEIFNYPHNFENLHNAVFDRGGTGALAAVRLAEKGICREGDLRSSLISTVELLPRGLTDYQGRPNKLQLLSTISRQMSRDNVALIKAQFTSLTKEEIEHELLISQPENILFNLTDRACKYRSIKALPGYKEFYPSNYERPNREHKMFAAIDRHVENKNPVAISVDGDIFDRSGGKPFTAETGHSVIIVGKRFNFQEREPEYIIRNSWGPAACERYLPDFRRFTPYAQRLTETILNRGNTCKKKCNETMDQEEFHSVQTCIDICNENQSADLIQANRPPYTCEKDGHYIVRQSHLEKVIYAYSYLE